MGRKELNINPLKAILPCPSYELRKNHHNKPQLGHAHQVVQQQ